MESNEEVVIEPVIDVGDIATYPSVTERYYKPRYYTVFERSVAVLHSSGKKEDGCMDTCILTHSNRICVVTVPESHPIHKGHGKVTKVDYQVSKNVNRLNNKAVGKSKKGAMFLNEDSPLCKVTCEDGQEFTIVSGVRGNLLEVNENLVTKPELITQKPDSDGYIAIVLPRLREYDNIIKSMLTKEDYLKILEDRASSVPICNKTEQDGDG